MAEPASLVPVPFYPPVRTDTGAFFRFGDPSDLPWPIEPRVPTAATETKAGTAYTRNGRLCAEGQVGTRVNIYV